MRAQLGEVLDGLEAREAAVVRMRYGLDGGQPKTLDEIGRAFKLSRERIRQIERETMAKLRHPSRAQVLRDYLDT
jgi:RNA polymerase sigma factor (sigma-70 family)